MTMRVPEAMEFAIVGSKLYRKAWGTKTHIQMTKIEPSPFIGYYINNELMHEWSPTTSDMFADDWRFPAR